ncbi:16S rRNA (uracil(1498)-N(3))-methyltransferase [Bacillus carboniphilus]|uniref:Ribosomal RNA small subunit methyltransferase E n=1 Tax=Bacillus carboniphilus TaxID=86663 RepID=A0ABY9JZX9_9BACI|nr:16S rRNA (uracil(1498)-N(3))-methyltransferase [Bacillus carboniphilus]WLR43995.1 16S rRNA (uracil(1498)-N(3))-methyltransferase [Bacillus carboniphilus]
MQRYFVSIKREDIEDQVKITGDDVHHISRVMRMKENEPLIICTLDGYTAKGLIQKITDDFVMVDRLSWIKSSSELPVHVTIASGMPKGDKLEYIIQKGTELGAKEFVPFNATRSIVKLDQKKIKNKVVRWNKIAKEAAEQSHRSLVPMVEKPLSFEELIEKASNYNYKIVAYEEESKQGEAKKLHQIISTIEKDQSLFVLFGPEGGFTEKELEILKENGFISCSLGPRILRAETAPLYLLSAVSYYLELMR